MIEDLTNSVPTPDEIPVFFNIEKIRPITRKWKINSKHTSNKTRRQFKKRRIKKKQEKTKGLFYFMQVSE